MGSAEVILVGSCVGLCDSGVCLVVVRDWVSGEVLVLTFLFYGIVLCRLKRRFLLGWL